MIRPIFAACLIAISSPLAAETHDHAHDDHDDHAEVHAFEIGGLEIVHPWVRATTSGETFLFMDLHNEGDAPVSIIGAHTEDAQSASLIGFSVANGTTSFVSLPPVPVAPGREMELAPDVMAIHLTGLAHDLEKGHHFDLILETSVGEIEIEAAVEAENAQHHSHAGHSH